MWHNHMQRFLWFCTTFPQLPLQVCLMVPWGLQLLFYSFLYRAFPRDRDRSLELEREGRLRLSSSETGILAPRGERLLLPFLSLGQCAADKPALVARLLVACQRGRR